MNENINPEISDFYNAHPDPFPGEDREILRKTQEILKPCKELDELMKRQERVYRTI